MKNMKDSVRKDLDAIKEFCDTISDTIGKILNKDDMEIEELRKILTFSNDYLCAAYRKINNLSFLIGAEPKKYQMLADCEPTMRITREENVYHIVLKELIPHKITYDVSTGKNKYSYNKDILYSGYRAAIEEYMLDHEVEVFTEPAVVAFIHHYPDDYGWIDHDNLHTKTFIDAVVKHVFIRDDSPKYMDLYQTSRICRNERPHTEVYIGIFSDVMTILNP